ncbi:MAG: PilZ domain-containing protein [Thermodesulfobacteriota bacterium]
MNDGRHERRHDFFPDGRLAERIVADRLHGVSSMTLTVRDLAMMEMEATLLNISETGIGVVMERELAVGQIVAVSSIPDDAMATKAVVMWCQQEGKRCRVGLKFIHAG